MCAHCSWNCSRYSCSLTRNYKIYILYMYYFYLNLHIVHFPTKRRELRHEDFWNTRHTLPHRLFQIVHLSNASSIWINAVHFSTKRREFCHENFWNTRHTAPRRLFQNVHPNAASKFPSLALVESTVDSVCVPLWFVVQPLDGVIVFTIHRRGQSCWPSHAPGWSR